MSQTVRISEVNGAFYPQVFTSFPNHEDAIQMVEDMLEDETILSCDDYYEVITNWYEIGVGESGTDVFFSDEELIEMRNKGYFMKEVKKKGYEIEFICDEIIRISADKLDE